jgi:hypothetical protein
MRRNRTLMSAALALVLGAAGCGDGTGPETTSLTLLLTDAPGDLTTAVVTISQIYLQGDEGEAEAEEEGGGPEVLMDAPVTVDLMTLQEDFETLVEDYEVASGSWGQLRFVITGGYIEVEGETPEDSQIFATSPDYEGLPEGAQVDGALQCPSCGQSGLKVSFAGALVLEGTEEQVVVDFDVSESYGQQAGGSGMWVMSPSLKGTVGEAEAEAP